METIMTYLLYLHVATGFVCLAAFWAPVFTRKGGGAHRKIGFVYVYGMWIVVITAGILSLNNLFIGRINPGLFLGFLSVISANPLWRGIAVLRNKRIARKSYRTIQLSLNITQFLFGTGLFLYGAFFITDGIRVLMMFFGFLGITSVREIISQWKTRTPHQDWYKEHYSGMITTGIAAYTAFFAFGGRQFLGDLLPGMMQIIPWILPTIIGISAMRLMDRKRSKRTSGKTQTTMITENS